VGSFFAFLLRPLLPSSILFWIPPLVSLGSLRVLLFTSLLGESQAELKRFPHVPRDPWSSVSKRRSIDIADYFLLLSPFAFIDGTALENPFPPFLFGSDILDTSI